MPRVTERQQAANALHRAFLINLMVETELDQARYRARLQSTHAIVTFRFFSIVPVPSTLLPFTLFFFLDRASSFRFLSALATRIWALRRVEGDGGGDSAFFLLLGVELPMLSRCN